MSDELPPTDAPEPDRTIARTPGDSREVHALPGGVPVGVPGYELFEVLGRGGMGAVYRARDLKLGRVVALKVLLGDGHRDDKAVIRFLAEAQSAAAVEHPHVVRVLDYGDHAGRPYMALEYCPGGSLADRLKATPRQASGGREPPVSEDLASGGRQPPESVPRPPESVKLPPHEAAALVGKIAAGVAAAHAAGIVHRDLKPGNVLFDAAGEPKVTDFGIAKRAAGADLTHTRAVMGTPHYMSPEQAGGGTKFVGPAADVWALGVVLYELTAGARPFAADTTEELLARVVSASPVPLRAAAPGTPRDLDLIVRKCLEKSPADRYPTAQELADDLGRFGRGEPITARPTGTVERAYKLAKRNKTVAGLLAAVVLAVVTGTIVGTVNYRRMDEQRGIAADEAAKKGQALADLGQTNQRLEAEKEAAEAAYFRGLLRPFFGARGSVWRADAFRATGLATFRELAAVTDEEVRLRFVDHAVATDGGPTVLIREQEQMTAVIVGLDRRAGVRLRDRLGEILMSETATPSARTACALWVTGLPAGNVEIETLAARVLVGRMGDEKDVYALPVLAGGLEMVAGRLPAADVADACGRAAWTIAKQIIVENDDVYASELPSYLKEIDWKLSMADATGIARALLTQLTNEKSPAKLTHLIEAFAAVAVKLPAADAAALCGPPARALAEWMAGEKDSKAIEVVSGALNSITKWLTAADSAEIARVLVARITEERSPTVLRYLAWTLAQVADRLPAADAALTYNPPARVLAGRLAGERDPFKLWPLAYALGMVAAGLSAAEAADLCGTHARTLAEQMTDEKDPSKLWSLAYALDALARRLPTAEAANLCRPPARALAGRMAGEKDGDTLRNLARGLREVAGWLPVAEAADICGPPARVLAEQITAPEDPDNLEKVAEALRHLAIWLTVADADGIARALSGRLANGDNIKHLFILAHTLYYVAKRLPAADASAICGTPTRSLAMYITRGNVSRKWIKSYDNYGNKAVGAVELLAGLLSPVDAADIADEAANFTLTRSNANIGNNIDFRDFILAKHLSADKATGVAQLLAKRLATEQQDDVVRVYVEKLIDLIRALPDSDLLLYLKLYGHISPPVGYGTDFQSAALAEFGRRSGRTQTPARAAAVGWAASLATDSPPFADVWEFVDWAEKHRPDLDLVSRPPVK